MATLAPQEDRKNAGQFAAEIAADFQKQVDGSSPSGIANTGKFVEAATLAYAVARKVDSFLSLSKYECDWLKRDILNAGQSLHSARARLQPGDQPRFIDALSDTLIRQHTPGYSHPEQAADFSGWVNQLVAMHHDTYAYVAAPKSHVRDDDFTEHVQTLAGLSFGETSGAESELKKLTYTMDCSALKAGDQIDVFRLDGSLTSKWRGEVLPDRAPEGQLPVWIKARAGLDGFYATFDVATGQAVTGVTQYQTMFVMPASKLDSEP